MKKPKRKNFRRTPSEIRHFEEKLRQYVDAGGYTNDELAEIFRISRRQLIRCKNKVTRGPSGIGPKEHEDSSLDLSKTRKINKNLNPIEFCDTYLTVKPNSIQRLIIKIFYGLELNPGELKIMIRWQKEGKTTWKENKKYKELVIIAGMKGGKTTLAALFVAIEEYNLYKLGLPWKHYDFTPGKEIYIMNVATDKDQARDTIFAEVKSSIRRSPYFKKRNPVEIASTFRFDDTNVVIKSGHSNSSSLVGKLCKLVLMDELDRFKTRGGKYSADEVYKALNRSTDPFREDGHIIAISSLVQESGKMVELYLKAKEIPTMVGFWLPEWEMMPEQYSGKTFPFSGANIPVEHQNEFNKDPEGFLRDKACMLGFTKGKFFRMPFKIDDCFNMAHNEGHRDPMDEDGNFTRDFHGKESFKYFMHGDASFNHDAYSICLAHREGENAVVDLMHRITPKNQMGEIDVEEVEKFILSVIDLFPNIEMFTYDTWAAASIKQAVDKKGKRTENLYILKPQYEFIKEKIYFNKLKCYKFAKVIEELKALELIGDKVDHPLNGSKDCADTLAGAVWDCMMNDSGVVAAGVVPSGENEKEKERPVNNRFNRRHIWDSAIH